MPMHTAQTGRKTGVCFSIFADAFDDRIKAFQTHTHTHRSSLRKPYSVWSFNGFISSMEINWKTTTFNRINGNCECLNCGQWSFVTLFGWFSNEITIARECVWNVSNQNTSKQIDKINPPLDTAPFQLADRESLPKGGVILNEVVCALCTRSVRRSTGRGAINEHGLIASIVT